jgi:phospholipid/cholesterol/gamma-HCH transport system substrate-binding protein
MFRALGAGLEGNGQELNDVLGGLGGSLKHGANVVDTLIDDRHQVRTLVKQLGSVSAAIGEREASIRQIAGKGLVSFNAIAGRDAKLRELLKTLPSTLRQVQTTTRTLDTVSGKASPVLTNLATALREVRPAVRTLRPAATNADAAVAELGRAAPGLAQTLRAVRSAAPSTATALGDVKDLICQVNPMLRYLKPYTPDVIQTVIGLGSAGNSYDAMGHLLRLIPIINDNTLVALPDAVSKSAYNLIHAGLLSRSTSLTYDPYPKPGMLGTSVAKLGDHVVGPADVPSTGYKFPHIQPDC